MSEITEKLDEYMEELGRCAGPYIDKLTETVDRYWDEIKAYGDRAIDEWKSLTRKSPTK